MRLMRQGAEVVLSAVAWEHAYLSAMAARGMVSVPVYCVGEAVPCAEIDTATEAVRLVAGREVTTPLAVVLHDEAWKQTAGQQ